MLTSWGQIELKYRDLSTEDGLPSNSIINIVQDPQGYIWMATSDGLCRYDGYSSDVLRHEENGNNKLLLTNQLRWLSQNPNGLLFINSDLVPQEPKRSDLRVHKIAVNTEAQKLGSDKAANIIMLGAILAETNLVKKETIEYELEQLFSGRKAKYLDMNRKALHLYF